MGTCDHHVFFGDQVFDSEVPCVMHDLRTTRVGVPVAYVLEFFHDDVEHAALGRKDIFEFFDQLECGIEIVQDLLPLETRQPLQPHVENGLRLRVGHAEVLDHPGAGDLGVLGTADQLDELIQVVECDLEALEDMGARFRLLEVEERAARDHLTAVLDERQQHLLEGQDHRSAILDREHIDAEGRSHAGLFVQIVENDVRFLAALDLDDDANPFAAGFVTNIGNTFEFLVSDEVGYLLDELRLVGLERHLGDDNAVTVATVRGTFRRSPSAHPDHPPAGLVRGHEPGGPIDDPGSRKIWAVDVLQKAVNGYLGLVDESNGGVNDLGQVMRWNVRGHADRDSGCAVDQEIREFSGEDGRLLERIVVVGLEVDGFSVDVREHLRRQPRHAGLGVPHRRRRVAVDRAEVSLTVDEWVAQREVLRHANEGVVGRLIAMRVILADDVTDDARTFLVRRVPTVVELLHGVQHAAMNRLQPVAHVG